jgi:hypothetical protein
MEKHYAWTAISPITALTFSKRFYSPPSSRLFQAVFWQKQYHLLTNLIHSQTAPPKGGVFYGVLAALSRRSCCLPAVVY